jgi:hypothetical protein
MFLNGHRESSSLLPSHLTFAANLPATLSSLFHSNLVPEPQSPHRFTLLSVFPPLFSRATHLRSTYRTAQGTTLHFISLPKLPGRLLLEFLQSSAAMWGSSSQELRRARGPPSLLRAGDPVCLSLLFFGHPDLRFHRSRDRISPIHLTVLFSWVVFRLVVSITAFVPSIRFCCDHPYLLTHQPFTRTLNTRSDELSLWPLRKVHAGQRAMWQSAEMKFTKGRVRCGRVRK